MLIFLICLISTLLIVYVSKHEDQIYLVILVISISTNNFFFDGRAVVDEILNIFLAIYCLKILFVNKNKYKSFFKNVKIEILLLLYLLLNSIFSLIINSENSSLRNYNESTLRFISVYLVFIVFLVTINIIPQNYFNIVKISLILFSANLFFWVAYWLALTSQGVSWVIEQNKSPTGSAYSAVLLVLGLLLNLTVLRNNPNNFSKFSFIINYLLTFVVSYMYSSRLIFGSLILIGIIIIIIKKSSPAVLFFGGGLIILLIFTQNIFTPGMLSNNTPPIDKNRSFLSADKFNDFKSSLSFILNPRLTDRDRSSQIKCSISLITQSTNLKEKVFGFGQSLHKSMMYKCSNLDPSTPGAPVRPVGIAAFIVDYGLFGIGLALALLSKLIFNLIRNKNSFINLIVLFSIPGWLFITNILDHSFIYVILFLNYIYQFNKQISSRRE